MGYFDTLKNLEGIRQRENQNALARQAGGMLSQGDQAGARNALWRGGELDAGFKIEEGMASSRKAQAEAMDRWTQGLGRMLQDPRYQGNPDAAWSDAVEFAGQLGLNPEALNKDKQAFDRNPEGWASFWNGQAKKDLQFFQTDQGIFVGDKGTGDVRQAARLPGKPQMYGDFLYIPEGDETPSPRVGTPGFNPNAPDPRRSSTEAPDSVFNSLIQQESGGRAGVLGPQTRYGRAEGMTQMLPATAQEMAQKLGIQWRPDLMRGTSSEAAEYQRQLGRAYYEEGLQKYGGDQAKALMYYHGGPNERLWGPKTRAYSEQVLARAGGGQQPLQGGAGGDDLSGAPAIPGMRVVGRVRGGEGKDAPSGYRWDGDNLKAIPGGPADPAVRAMGTGSRREFASLRKEFNSLEEVKNWKDTAAAYNQIRSLASKPNPTPADDMALTYAFMKANDPGSVVRESEFAMVAKTAGLPDQVAIALDKLTKGQGLTPRIRQQLVQAAATMTLRRREAYDAQARNYRAIAGDLGADADQLAEDPAKWRGRIKQPAAKATPTAKPSDGWGKLTVK